MPWSATPATVTVGAVRSMVKRTVRSAVLPAASVAFASTRGGKTQIFVMNDDGAALRPLTADGNNYSPDWSGYTP